MDVSKCTKEAAFSVGQMVFVREDGLDDRQVAFAYVGPAESVLTANENAALFAEALTVATETGLSPRQLAERVSVLEKALRTSAEVMKSINPIVFANSILAIEETLAATAGKGAE